MTLIYSFYIKRIYSLESGKKGNKYNTITTIILNKIIARGGISKIKQFLLLLINTHLSVRIGQSKTYSLHLKYFSRFKI